MLKMFIERLRQGHRTAAYPDEPAVLPDRFRGHPLLDAARCPDGCRQCVDACPTDAARVDVAGLALDLGRCLFCGECATACPEGAITFSGDHAMAARRRDELLLRGELLEWPRPLDDDQLRIFRRSLKLRQVSAGGCNGCEADVNVLSTPVFDLGRFGIQLVASPRHADGLLVTGAVTENMKLALEKTWAAVPAPKIVIAVGACAISGGPYAGHPEVLDGADGVLPVDLYIPGCPPHPYTILEGLLALLDRLSPERVRAIMPDDDEKADWARRRAESALRYLGADEGPRPPNG